MNKRFTPFPKLPTKFGAPMGRTSTPLPPDTPLEKLAAAGPAGEYDAGGAYWGLGAEPVWAVWVKGAGRSGVTYVRARSADAAKRIAIDYHATKPNR